MHYLRSTAGILVAALPQVSGAEPERSLCERRTVVFAGASQPPTSIISDRQDWVEEISGSTQCFLSRRAGVMILIGTVRAQEIVVRGTMR